MPFQFGTKLSNSKFSHETDLQMKAIITKNKAGNVSSDDLWRKYHQTDLLEILANTPATLENEPFEILSS